ncbi:DUF6239 family natural product biosynthesis protein [Saccharothrix obliqua]|uniref:DUF6239 family natural product biosynthesis protein n=1 Tax=Saccharothrix obliqua TaxID=2861747 RepID=UPI001C5DC1E7|nr:DUF6239 family natural product biosynthesis protein [Saccharothrix obliqua]MBW4721808.1 hypothetical protein [Saccharothrix obliqua]
MRTALSTRAAGGALIAGALVLVTATPAVAQGHDHVITSPIVIGPLVPRLAMLSAMPVVTGFALLRTFVPTPGRTTSAAVAWAAAVLVVLQLMLTDVLDMPPQVAVLALAAASAPLLPILSRNPRHTRLSGVAPWAIAASAGVAAVVFARAWLGSWEEQALGALLHTALVLAFPGLSWAAAWRPRSRAARVVVGAVAALLSCAVIAATAQVAVMRPFDA